MHRWESTYLDTVESLKASDASDELCCVFARDWTGRLYGIDVVKRVPNALWCLYPPDPKDSNAGDPWGPVTACVKSGIGDIALALVPGRWHRIQGWRGKPFAAGVSGHTITVFAGPHTHAIVYDSAKDPRGAKTTLVVWADYVKQFTGGIAIAVLEEP